MFKCEFPGCCYETSARSLMTEHHIIPKSFKGSNKPHNRLFLCPSHHHHINVPGMVNGIHSQQTEHSIVINGKMLSTAGPLFEYYHVHEPDNLKYTLLKNSY